MHAVARTVTVLLMAALLSGTCLANDIGARHMTGACLSRTESGDILVLAQHWHAYNAPPNTGTWNIATASASDSGPFTDYNVGCNAPNCANACTSYGTCGATGMTGAWTAIIDDTPPRFTPGEQAVLQMLNTDIYLAPTGSCPSINGGYGIDGGSQITTTIPPARTTCFADICGDGFRAPAGEDCEGSDLGGATCLTLGFDGGSLSCSTCCTYDTSSCLTCDDSANAPVLNGCLSGTVTLSADPGACCASDSFTVTASDADTGLCQPPTLLHNMGQASPACYVDGEVVQWSANDSSGQVTACSWTYEVLDQEMPAFTACPASALAYVNQAVSYGPVSASDNCGGLTVTQTAGPAPGTVISSPGTQLVVFEAEDSSANVVQCSFTLTVENVVLSLVGITPPNEVFVYMYLPVEVYYAENHQGAYGNVAGDGSLDYFELHVAGDPAAAYVSEYGSASAPSEAHMAQFTGLHSVMPGYYEFWACMTSTGPNPACTKVFDEVTVCASPYNNVPQGCAY